MLDKKFSIRIESKDENAVFEEVELKFPTYEEAITSKQELEDEGYKVSEIIEIRL